MGSKSRKSRKSRSKKKEKVGSSNNNHNEKLLTLLTSYASDDKKQNNNKNQFIKLLQDFPQYCFGREINVPHFCGGGMLVDKSGEYVLLAQHRKLDILTFFGGHADGDSDLLNVARKETIEESGFNDIQLLSDGIFDLDLQTCFYNTETHFHFELRFLFQTQQEASDDIKPPNIESKELKWIHYKNDDAISTMRESMVRMFEEYRKFKDKK